ncbi:MAG TPA: glycoside hydrolase family 32 protein [Candidatus Acidoferrum sp.]|nr:glycoside hydrolase family 32 protein [Candidatus Acidoferrum sp.]
MFASRRRFLTMLAAGPSAAACFAENFSHWDFVAGNETQARLAEDPLRPQFHLLPAKNWMNDPNGPIRWQGQYHMFFQYNPNAAVWGDMHWAHAVSPDMIHWKHLPIGLAPTPGWDDADGCFTGSAVNDNGTATVLYTGVKACPPEVATLRDGAHNFRETQCLATSSDPLLRTWTKFPTPVVQPPADPLLTGFRDPFVWREPEGWWYMGVASGLRQQGGRVLLYRSKNLRQWEYLHPLATGKWTERDNKNPVESGEMWECPDFFALGKKFVLLYSTAGRVIWETGELDRKEMRFHSERSGLLDHGAYYAQKTQAGEPILWGWIPETRPEAEFSGAGWAGCMALPRSLSLDAKNDLQMEVSPAAKSLRVKEFASGKEKSARERQILLSGIRIENVAGEFQWSIKAPTQAIALTLEDNAGPWWSFRATPDGPSTKLSVNDKIMQIPATDEIECRLFVDASVAEFFCNRLHVLTSRIYRKPEGPLRITIGEADASQLREFKAWQLKAISRDRLTT